MARFDSSVLPLPDDETDEGRNDYKHNARGAAMAMRMIVALLLRK